MPPPPVTPSPHRFIVKKDSDPVQRTPLAQPHTSRPSTQQFKAAPRFTLSSTPRPTASQALSSHVSGAGRFTTPGPKAAQKKDVIEDLSDESTEDVHESIERDTYDYYDYNNNDDERAFESAGDDAFDIAEEPKLKRRRLTSPILEEEDQQTQARNPTQPVDADEDTSSSIPSLPSPQAKRPQSSHDHQYRKFLISTPTQATTLPPSTSPQKGFIKPPRFLAPGPAEQNLSDPLPDQFSPHRKGQKYMTGGLASEVRDWLTNINTSIAVPTAKREDDQWRVRILIDEISGGGRAGMTFVKGQRVHVNEDGRRMFDHPGELRVILAGEGMGVGVQKGEKAQVGRVVGVRGPVWEVVLEGVKWGVGVEWKVLIEIEHNS